jgi:hypothetical protein
VPKDGDRVEQRIAFSGFVFRRVERNFSKYSLMAAVISGVFISDIIRYLNQQKHFISGLFDPLYLETNIDMFLQFIVNLSYLGVKYLQGLRDGSPAYLRLASSARRT